MEKFQFKLLLLPLICIICSAAPTGFGFTCKKVERNALLKLKYSFQDPYNLLDSWVGEDCCKWKGVGCHNLTGNVIKLDLGPESLGFPFLRQPISDFNLAAREVNPALLELKYLTYLDLSWNYFHGSRIPKFLGSMTQLQHLDLSDTFLSGEIPQNLGNLTKLVHLDLSDCASYSNNLDWASKLQNLQYLDLSLIDMSQAIDSLNLLLPSVLFLGLVGCQLENSHYAKRNLSISSSPLQHLDLSLNFFGGPFPSFIQNLSAIRFLDLSFNQLSSTIPLWLGDQKDLKELKLRENLLTGSLPPFKQNFSSIESLDLSNNQLSSSIPSWLGNQIDLKELDLSNNLFTGPFPFSLQNLSSIESVDLSSNSFKSSLPSWMASKKLKHLNLAQNSFNGPFPQFIQNSSSLVRFDLSHNQFSLSIPSWLAEKRELESVDLTDNQFDGVDGGIMNILGRLCRLQYFSLSDNWVQEEISESHANISECAKYDMEYLVLRNNSLSNRHLAVLQSFSSLRSLDLSQNNLETMPFLGSFSSLEYLDLSDNHLTVVNQESLANLSELYSLNLSSNPFLLDVSPDWMPPFQLQNLDILPYKFNGPFPKWLLSQTQLVELDLSDTGIFGALPDNIGSAMSSLQSLRLANNSISGSVPKSLCESNNLNILDLRKNWLSGMIPDCWENSQNLEVVELSSNRLLGPIPNSLTKLPNLQLLSLNNNSLEGELPVVTSRCERLLVFDVGMNNLHGEIPSWNGTNFPSLQILILRENRLQGMIPPQLCSVHALQVIDLAGNGLNGTIPQCFGHFEGMGSAQQPDDSIAFPPSSNSSVASYIAWEPAVSPDEWSAMEVIKGEEREYTSVLHLLVNIDLSCNNLVGVIPTNLTSLSLLIGLNLSHNHFNGAIPKEIGKMEKLESLDLSSNNLSGSIPESISSLNYLSTMNLSFNNLHGQIPTGNQLRTLDDPSIYSGNPGLCGDPLPKKCFGIAQPPTGVVSFTEEEEEEDEDDKHEKMWFYMVIMLGFATGFWGVIGALVVKREWRHAYFGIGEEIGDWLYVRVALWIAKVNVTQASNE